MKHTRRGTWGDVGDIQSSAGRSSWQPWNGLIIIARLKTIPRHSCDRRGLLCKQIGVTIITLCQVQNRLKELAQRQHDLNEKLKELQNALQEAKTEEEKEEIVETLPLPEAEQPLPLMPK